jgi:hypothetical protein
MFGTIVTLICLAAAFKVSLLWWRSFLNPVAFGILAWTPALVMLNWQPFFVSPLYIQLNRPVSASIYIALVVAFSSFWFGCMTVKALAKSGDFRVNEQLILSRFAPGRGLLLFIIGFLVFSYSYLQSGLTGMSQLDAAGVAESRLALHIGWISFIGLLMDITAIAFFAYFLRTGKWLFVLPIIIALVAYGATLQKSPVVWLGAGCAIASLLQPSASKRLLWHNVAARVIVLTISFLIILAMFWMNDVRGMSAAQLTTSSAAWEEQLFIYSGASAIKNLAVTIDGYLPSDPPALGAYLMRPLFWLFLDMESLQVSRYFEGVNTGTYLIYGWADFRWLGLVLTPFLAGILVMVYLRFATRGELWGLILGAIALRALAISASTDFLFDPTATILIVLALGASWFTRTTEKEEQSVNYGRYGRPIVSQALDRR